MNSPLVVTLREISRFMMWTPKDASRVPAIKHTCFKKILSASRRARVELGERVLCICEGLRTEVNCLRHRRPQYSDVKAYASEKLTPICLCGALGHSQHHRRHLRLLPSAVLVKRMQNIRRNCSLHGRFRVSHRPWALISTLSRRGNSRRAGLFSMKARWLMPPQRANTYSKRERTGSHHPTNTFNQLFSNRDRSE